MSTKLTPEPFRFRKQQHTAEVRSTIGTRDPPSFFGSRNYAMNRLRFRVARDYLLIREVISTAFLLGKVLERRVRIKQLRFYDQL